MKSFRHYRRYLAAAALAVAAACSTKSPTEPGSPPITPKVPPPVSTFSITVTANPTHLTIGTSSGSKIAVSAVNVQDGTPPPDLTPIILTTTLGEFNAVGSGLQSITLQLVHGKAQAVLFPGTSAGTGTVSATGPAPPNGVSPVYSPGAATIVISSAGTFFVNSLSPNTGDPAGGTLVTISGGGFLAPVAVTFGGSSAPVKSVSTNAIQVIAPPSATPVPVGQVLQVSVIVTNDVGSSQTGTATLTNAFTYVPGGGGVQQPQIFSVSPASGTNDGGTRVTITGEFFVPPVQVFFGTGQSPTAFNGLEATVQSVTGNQIIAISPPARGFGQDNTNVLVSIMVKNVTSGFATIDSAAFKYGSKVLVTSVGPNITQFNQPVKVTVFGQGFADPVSVGLAGVAAQVLSTSGTEIQVLSGIPIVSSCANITGPVTVTNINNGDSNSGASFTYIVPKPSANGVNPSGAFVPAGGLPAVVTGGPFIPGEDTVQVGNSAASVTGGTSGSLNIIIPPFNGTFPTAPCGANNTGTMTIPTSVAVVVTDTQTTCSSTLAGGFTYFPTVSGDGPCITPPPAPPTASFVDSVPTGSFKVTFTDTSTGNPTSWSWNFGDGATSTVQNPVHTYAVAGMYNVVLVVTGAGGTSAPFTKSVTVPGM
jgi:PKD repeat protein